MKLKCSYDLYTYVYKHQVYLCSTLGIVPCAPQLDEAMTDGVKNTDTRFLISLVGESLPWSELPL